MLFHNPSLIINKLQPSVDFAVRDQQEIILKYRKENGGNALPKIGQNRHSLFLHARHCPLLFATVHVTSATVPSLLFATVHVSSATVHVSFADVPHQPPSKKTHFILFLKLFYLSLLQFTTFLWIQYNIYCLTMNNEQKLRLND